MQLGWGVKKKKNKNKRRDVVVVSLAQDGKLKGAAA